MKQATKRAGQENKNKKNVKFLDEMLEQAKKDGFSFTKEQFLLYIDKFISKERNVACIALDNEY